MNTLPWPTQFPVLLRFAAVAGLAAFLSGCVASGYALADRRTPPATPIGHRVTAPTVDLTLEALIVYTSPGSWKREAYWDEYVVSLTNRGGAPITIDEASLSDFQGIVTTSRNEPWSLEKESKTYREKFAGNAENALRIGGGFATTSGASLMGGLIVGMASGSGAAAVGTLFGGPAVFVGGTVYRNVTNKHKIEAEFARRNLVLPLTLAPGQTAAGSFFFRISPGPQRLEVRYRDGVNLHSVRLSLPMLADLHLAEKSTVDARATINRLPQVAPSESPPPNLGGNTVTVRVDASTPLTRVLVNGRSAGNTPVDIHLEVDAGGALVRDVAISTSGGLRTVGGSSAGTKVYRAGTVPPAKIEVRNGRFSETGEAQGRNAPEILPSDA